MLFSDDTLFKPSRRHAWVGQPSIPMAQVVEPNILVDSNR